MRKILLSLIVIIALGGIGYGGYLFLKTQSSSSNSTIFQAIPNNAAFIIQTKNTLKTWRELKESNLGKTLSHVKSIQNTFSFLETADSLAQKNVFWENLFNSKEVCFSGHVNGINSFGLILTTTASAIDLENAETEIKGIFPKLKVSGRNYDEVPIKDYILNEKGDKLSVCYMNGLMIASLSPILVEDAIRQLKHGKPLTNDKRFKKLNKTADINLNGSFYIQYPEFGKILSQITNKDNSAIEKRMELFGTWMELDMNLKKNGIMLNGFSILFDSIPTYLSALNSESPGNLNIASVLPNNTGYFFNVNVSSFNSYYGKYKSYLTEKKELFSYNKTLKSISQKNNFSVKNDFFSWLGENFCVFITEGEQINPYENLAAIFKTNDIEKAISKLKEINDKTNPNYTPIEYRNYNIYNLGLTNVLPLALGDLFNGLKNSYYTIIEDYVVFANSQSNLKHIIHSYLSGKTLIKSVDFNNFVNNFSDQSSIFVYNNFRLTNNFWPYFLEKETAENLKEKADSLNNLEAFGFQIISNNKIYYSNAYFNYNPKEENQTISLLETKLDTSFNKKPWVVLNHYTKDNELLIQDANNVLYLVSDVGKVLWKKPLDGPVLGDVHQVDRYKNKKLQYLFGTKNKLYLVDRNGKNVDNYPIKTKEELTAGITVLDYDNNRNYRVLVPCGNKIFNYTIDGKKVKGWKTISFSTTISTPAQLLQIKKKDYVIGVDNNGEVKVLNRRGEERVVLNNKLPKGNRYEIIREGSLSNSGVATTDSNGTFYFLKLIDDLDPITFKAFSSNHKFTTGDIDEDGIMDIIYADENKVYAYKQSKKLIFELEDIPASDIINLNVFKLSRKNSVLALSLKSERKVYVFDSKGNLFESFPLDGETPVIVNDINKDGRFDVIIGDNKGSLYFYSLF